jgi:hypothetical protein
LRESLLRGLNDLSSSERAVRAGLLSAPDLSVRSSRESLLRGLNDLTSLDRLLSEGFSEPNLSLLPLPVVFDLASLEKVGLSEREELNDFLDLSELNSLPLFPGAREDLRSESPRFGAFLLFAVDPARGCRFSVLAIYRE